MEHLVYVAAYVGLFSMLDCALTYANVQGVYYAVHALHNAAIVYLTAPDVIHTVTNFHNITAYPANQDAIHLCFALHLYHVMLYHSKFRADDWLHHGLMLGLALPIGCVLESHTLMGMSLFMTTGLSGGIDYALLCGVRNGLVHKNTEKAVNTFLNVWIRSPGCAGFAALSLAYLLSHASFPSMSTPVVCAYLAPTILNYWNGQYFMRQVVEDYARIGRSV
jgi:hypothetical protein